MTGESTDGPENKFWVFISYTRREGEEHKKRVERLYQLLTEARNLHVFKDDHEVVAGEELTPRLKEEIRKCDLFVSMLSKQYFDSKWCRDELEEALKKKKQVTPVVFDYDGFRYEDFKYPESLSEKYSELNDKLRQKFDCEESNQEEKCTEKILQFIEKIMKKKHPVRQYTKK